jgi:hypothetical protein
VAPAATVTSLGECGQAPVSALPAEGLEVPRPLRLVLTAVIRKAATGSVPSLLAISAAVLTVQTAMMLATGELWLFLLQFPAREPLHVRHVRPDGKRPGPARCPARG